MANDSDNDFDPKDEDDEDPKDGVADSSKQDDEGDKGQSSDDDSDDDGEFDAAVEIAALEQKVNDGTVTKADFAAFKSSVQRTLGQVSRLQSGFDKMGADAIDPSDFELMGEQLAALSDALSTSIDPSDPLHARIAEIRAKKVSADATRAAVEKIREETASDDEADDDGTGNQMSPARRAELNAASATVKGYAHAKSVEIPEDAWAKAMQGSSGMTEKAVDLMYETIDALVPTVDAKQADRKRRKGAGTAGNPPKTGSGKSGGRLTWDALAAMSEAEIAELPAEEIDRVLAAGKD